MKKITMPYEEYLDDLKRVEQEIFLEKIAPVLNLISVEVSGAQTIDKVPHAYWKFQGTVEELLNALCKIHGVDNLSKTVANLRKRYG